MRIPNNPDNPVLTGNFPGVVTVEYYNIHNTSQVYNCTTSPVEPDDDDVGYIWDDQILCRTQGHIDINTYIHLLLPLALFLSLSGLFGLFGLCEEVYSYVKSYRR